MAKQQFTEQQLEAKLQQARLNLNNPKIQKNKGALTSIKNLITRLEEEVANLKSSTGDSKKEQKVQKTPKEKVEKRVLDSRMAGKDLSSQSIRFQIAYLIHSGVSREDILKNHGFESKQYTDAAYHYVRSYKQKVLDYIKENK